MIDNPSILYYGGPLVSDFNADAVLDILFPGCREETCRHVTHFNIWTKGVWSSFQLDQKVFYLMSSVNILNYDFRMLNL